uniref:Uncharacterized protein n=1 Tax=Phaeomonas parva TaxID=124430 RepID=A0A6U4FI15_9STRA|mmetsp:Transcript_25828/g.80869  ORF Transcript_25828/g.80869 Transcript_25828/m.80869 type:complete len:432 (+) Transcript_25828:344-1639(+)|eukprot:CAMPEP_0118852788 /NCGR_PEP_ID=MMETSP1163-20130328/1641_1 /TAXON_ID=124430 /ORGANISM="Phaeomonas parva, Strain CCMP2877" /LENGTH=431 /DNA_ID=CAMNT_0006785253 /DNA_START=316 /DNA_END=1611 /DNA_ORIENTATION=-
MADHTSKEVPRGVGDAKEESSSGKRTGKENTGRWSYEEHRLFLKGLEMHGKGWKKIAELIKTRTVVQIRTHAQKYFQKLAKAKQGGAEPGAVLLDRGLGRKNGKRKSGSLEGTAVAPSLQPYMTLPGVNGSVESGLYKFLSPNVITSFVDDDKAAKAQAASRASSAAAQQQAAQRAKQGVTPAEAVRMGYAPTPDWYAKGNNVDVLLNEAEGLDWLADSGGNHGNDGSEEQKEGKVPAPGHARHRQGQAKVHAAAAHAQGVAEAQAFAHEIGAGSATRMHRSVSNPDVVYHSPHSFGAEEATQTLDDILGHRSQSMTALNPFDDDVIIGATLGIDEEDDGGVVPSGFDDGMDILQDILHRDPLSHLDAGGQAHGGGLGSGLGLNMDGVDFAREIESLPPALQVGSAAAMHEAPRVDDDDEMQLDFDELGML